MPLIRMPSFYVVERRHPHQHVACTLARCVGTEAGPQRKDAEVRDRVDDGAAALGAHLVDLVLHAPPRALVVHVDHEVDCLGGRLGDWGWRCERTGIVERDVDSSELANGGRDRRGDALVVGDVAGYCRDVQPSSRRSLASDSSGSGPLFGGRPVSMSEAPSAAIAREVASPIPPAAPVMKTTLSVKR